MKDFQIFQYFRRTIRKKLKFPSANALCVFSRVFSVYCCCDKGCFGLRPDVKDIILPEPISLSFIVGTLFEARFFFPSFCKNTHSGQSQGFLRRGTLVKHY